MEIRFDKFEEQVFLNTVLIENLTDGEFGTGFLVLKPSVEGKQKILLFSNKHVFWGKKDKDNPEAKKSLRITLHKRNEDDTYTLGNIQTFPGELGRKMPGYYEHPNTAVDIACINISDLANKGVKLNINGLDIEQFTAFKREKLYAGMNVVFVGYPSGFYDKKNFLPVMRSGTIASIPMVDFNGEPKVLLDAQIFPGSSGSPVFASIEGKYNLLGIVSDGIHKNLDFVEIEKATEPIKEKVNIPREWIGLGMLFTSEMIKEVYDMA